MKEHPDTNAMEMDCVEGKKGESRVILTFTLRNYHLMLMFHLEYQDQECVLKVFVWLKTVHSKKPLEPFFPLSSRMAVQNSLPGKRWRNAAKEAKYNYFFL